MSKLLIVDDESDVREFAGNFFRKRDIDVFTASGGKDALKIIDDKKPDLVLLDVRMEEMTGIEVLKILRAKNNRVKVILVTGVENGEAVKDAWDLGITGYIHKPLILEELEKIVLKELSS